MAPLHVRKIPGIGKHAQSWLNALSVETCADIWKNRGRLALMRCDLSDLIRAYLGIGDASVSNGKREERLSCGRGQNGSASAMILSHSLPFCIGWTFAPTDDYTQFLVELKAMAEQVAEDLAEAEVSGRSITLEIKYDTFEIEVRSYSAGPLSYFHTSDELYTIGRRLLDKELEKRKAALKVGKTVVGSYGVANPILRRLSLRVSQLRDDSQVAVTRRGEDGKELFDSVHRLHALRLR